MIKIPISIVIVLNNNCIITVHNLKYILDGTHERSFSLRPKWKVSTSSAAVQMELNKVLYFQKF